MTLLPGSLSVLSGSLSVLSGLTGHLSGKFHKPLSSLRVDVKDHILDAFEKLRVDLIIDLQHGRIDDRHVETCLDRMEEECGVHGLTYGVVAAECE